MNVGALNAADAGDVAAYKSVRLRALLMNPEAFASTYERELAFDDESWRSRVGGFRGRLGTVFLAQDDIGPTGIAGIGLEDTSEHDCVMTAYLWGMWVDPRARGNGTSGALVSACISWAAASKVSRVVLDVVRDNSVAIGLYARFGFLPTGRVAGLASNPCAEELEMCLLVPH